MSYNTKQREILTEFFKKNHDKLFSAEEIADNLKNKDISLSAVYRNLADLEKLGRVRKTTKQGSRKAYFQFVDCDDCKGHLHLSCTKCGKTTHLDENQTSNLMKNVLKNSDFDIDENQTVIYGVCKVCKNKK